MIQILWIKCVWAHTQVRPNFGQVRLAEPKVCLAELQVHLALTQPPLGTCQSWGGSWQSPTWPKPSEGAMTKKLINIFFYLLLQPSKTQMILFFTVFVMSWAAITTCLGCIWWQVKKTISKLSFFKKNKGRPSYSRGKVKRGTVISCMSAQGQTCKGKRKEKRKQKTLTVFWDESEDMVNRWSYWPRALISPAELGDVPRSLPCPSWQIKPPGHLFNPHWHSANRDLGLCPNPLDSQ